MKRALTLSKTTRRVLWVVSIGLVLLMGLYYFPREYPGLSFWESLYSTLRLFVFERDLPVFPIHWQLILIYFLAPFITLSAAGAVISYLFRVSPALKTKWMSEHVVICGVGRTGKLIAERLKSRDVPVVGVDRGPAEAFEEWRAKTRVPMIFGDFSQQILLEKCGAARARSIIFASGNDLANLEGSLAAYEWLQRKSGPVQLLWTHIANEKLANTARAVMMTDGMVGIRFFDTYRIAAIRMISTYFNREKRKGVTEVSIIGFGKFGRDLFEILIRDIDDSERFSVRVIDIRDRQKAVCALAEELGVAERVTFERANIQEMELCDERDKAFFLCTDDDLGNLSAAMDLASKYDTTNIFVRMATWPVSAIADHIGEDRGIYFVNINNLVVHGIESMPGVLKSADVSDIKRAKKI